MRSQVSFDQYTVPRRTNFPAPSPMEAVDASLREHVDAAARTQQQELAAEVPAQVPDNVACATGLHLALQTSLNARW